LLIGGSALPPTSAMFQRANSSTMGVRCVLSAIFITAAPETWAVTGCFPAPESDPGVATKTTPLAGDWFKRFRLPYEAAFLFEA
jgi:hypothetical protein